MEDSIPPQDQSASETSETQHRFAFLKNRHIQAALLLALLLLVALPLRYAYFLAFPAGDGSTVRIVDFAKGEPLAQIAADLERERIVSSARLFVVHARLKGADGRLQAGEYQFSDGMRPTEILRKMVTGEINVRRFAIPEGYSIHQVAELLESQKLFSREGFIKAATDPTLLAELGVEGNSVEGYLFPSTYNVTRKMDEAALIRAMAAQFNKIYGERFVEATRRSGMTRHEVVTLASLIEKEAVVAAERPLISSVFHNRLARGMRLQSDPTAVYGVRAFGGTVTKQDIERHTPYNTYLITALPPGPIGNPSEGAIEAALTPARTGYLYFVAKKDGTHHFSTTLDEHNAAVNTYLKSNRTGAAH
ncbi:endolytic transglycosylase MltG [Geobacter sp.]|uniref:endolytic transglycosylase MltG n=1 Tax=Geobacter sp. TaxID=46610 RepID=UPI0027B8BBA0|nr:endolytic transglycosylase MltG [Geobacter sp.]